MQVVRNRLEYAKNINPKYHIKIYSITNNHQL